MTGTLPVFQRLLRTMRRAATLVPGARTLWYYHVLTRRPRRIVEGPLTRVPRKLKMELTNACNFRCVMCAKHEARRRRGFMDFGLYTAIVDQGARLGTEDVYVYSTGESLLHPRFCDMVAYAKSKGRRVIVTTNASLLTPAISDRLLDTGVDVMKYSAEGADAAAYEAIRRGGKWARLFENIGYFKGARDRRGAATEIFVNAVYLNDDLEQAARFHAVFSPYVDQVNFYPLANHGGNIDAERMAALEPGAHAGRLAGAAVTPCVHLWNALTVTWDGKGVLCNYDYEAETVVGDLTRDSLEAVWHSARMAEYRRLHREGRQAEMPVCGQCTDLFVCDRGLLGALAMDIHGEKNFLKTSFEAHVFNEKVRGYARRRAHQASPPTVASSTTTAM